MLLTAIAVLAMTGFDEVRVDVPTQNHSALLYGCNTVIEGNVMAVVCDGSRMLASTAIPATKGRPMREFAVSSPGFQWYTEWGNCVLTDSHPGTMNEMQYVLNCGDVILMDGFDGS